MNEHEVMVRNIVSEIWETHYMLAEPYFDRLYNEAEKNKPINEIIVSAPGGDSFDWEISLKIAYAAIQLTILIIQEYRKYQERNGRKPTKEELKAEIENKKPKDTFITSGEADKVVEYLTQK